MYPDNALGVRPGVVALDGEVGNSTYAGEFASTFAAFFSRGYDFLRMAGITGRTSSRRHLRVPDRRHRPRTAEGLKDGGS